MNAHYRATLFFLILKPSRISSLILDSRPTVAFPLFYQNGRVGVIQCFITVITRINCYIY